MVAEADTYHQNGVDLFNEKKYEDAINNFREAARLRPKLIADEQRLAKDSATREELLLGQIKSLNNIGNCLYKLKRFEEAQTALQESIDFQDFCRKKWHYSQPDRLANAHKLLGQVLCDSGGMEDALINYRLALLYFDSAALQVDMASIYSDISDLYIYWRLPDSIVQFALKALEILKNNPDADIEARAYSNLGVGYKNQGKYTEALTAYDSSLTKYDASNSADIASVFHNKAKVFRLLGDYKAAFASIDKAIDIRSADPQKFKENLASDYSNNAEIYLSSGDQNNALAYFEKSIRQFLYGDSDFHNNDLNFDKVPIISEKVNFIEALEGRARTHLIMGNTDQAQLAFDDAIKVIDQFRLSFIDNKSKLLLADVTKRIFEGAIATALALDKFDAAFGYSEKSKAFVLWESVKLQQSAQNMDRDLQKRLNEVVSKIASLEGQITNASDSLTGKLLQTQKQLHEELQQIKAQVEKDEAYRRMAALFTPLTSKQIQTQLLATNQTLVEYFLGANDVYVFVIPPGQAPPKAYVFEKNRNELATEIENLLLSIQVDASSGSSAVVALFNNRFQGVNPSAIYTGLASSLYSTLLPAPLVQSNNKDYHRLLIIPDDVLGYLPFDVLLTDTVAELSKYANYPYLASQYAISYCYSVAMLNEMIANHTKTANRAMLAYAYPNELDYFVAQVELLQSQPGLSKMDSLKNNASEDRMKKQGDRYRIIHFATHGHMNDRDPNYSYLLMRYPPEEKADSALFLHEIYGMNLNADLVFTSACEAGIGQLYRGEGIMSLARGFSYAGAGSIVTTLWKINQQKANVLVESFYKSLLGDKKMSKDEALFEAKKAYLKSAGHRDAAPYYWACFIPIGDMAPLKEGGRTMYWLWAAPALIVLLAALRTRRRRRQTA